MKENETKKQLRSVVKMPYIQRKKSAEFSVLSKKFKNTLSTFINGKVIVYLY